MKKLNAISVTPALLILTMVFIISTPTQAKKNKTHMDNAYQNRPSISGLILAYHNVPTEQDSWENLDIYEISNFVDESIRNGTLLGHGSSSLATNRLNILKDRIEKAANALTHSTFEEACQYLLDAYLSTDGLNQPADLVYGQAAPELAKKIKLMRIHVIGCE